jgi:hypothetical protein
MLFSVAQTMAKRPAESAKVAAIFSYIHKLDLHSIGIGIMNSKTSVVTFVTNATQTIGFDIAGWQTSPGFDNVRQ